MADVYLGVKTMTYKNPNYHKEYAATHKEQCKAIRKKYYETHKEEIKEKSKEYRVINIEHERITGRIRVKRSYNTRKKRKDDCKKQNELKHIVKYKNKYFLRSTLYRDFSFENMINIKRNKEKARKLAKEWYKNNRERSIKNREEYNKNHPDWHRRYWLKKQFNITLEEYNNLFSKQEGKCAICGEHQDNIGKTLGVDHDHFTDEVRGLLCYNCNLLLGHAKDRTYILRKAIEYLEKDFV